jgi:hypothetical protein
MPLLERTRQRRHQHNLIALSSCQTTPLRLLAQDEDPILHVARGRVGFNKDHYPPCADQRRKSLPSSYFIIFPLSNTYMHIRLDVTLAWSSTSTSRHDQHCLGSAITSKTRQHHRQYDSTTISRHG